MIDPRFRAYFDNNPKTSIRLDEIRWGGVRRDGIPPLKNPKMISAVEATYLGDQDIIFGVALDGDVRAYPKRILAWHEMFKDRIAGREINGVYCTLCGSMILYDTTVKGVQHELDTSGFLYRSNKLMVWLVFGVSHDAPGQISGIKPRAKKTWRLRPLFTGTN